MPEDRAVSKLPKDPGPAAWREILDDLPAYRNLKVTTQLTGWLSAAALPVFRLHAG